MFVLLIIMLASFKSVKKIKSEFFIENFKLEWDKNLMNFIVRV